MPAINEQVTYRSISGDEWEATIFDVHPDGRVDIFVALPNAKPTDEIAGYFFRAIRWYDDRNVPLPGARPRKDADSARAEQIP